MKYYTYQVLNQSNGKKYFGFTTNPEQRWKKHLDGIKAKKKSCPYFHNALKKGPLSNFTFSIIGEYKNKEQALEEEINLIKKYNTQNPNFGYNISSGGESGGFIDESHREKCIMRMKTNNPMKKLRTNKGTFKKGCCHIMTEETKKKISESKKGKNNPMYGNKEAANHLNKMKYNCSHCGKTCNLGNLNRWHMSNCSVIKV